MTQNEKELLLKDLSCRLPYGVICEDGYGNDLELNGIDKPNTVTFKCATKSFWITDLDKCRPYLFPISSMTEEQKNEYNSWKHLIPVCRYEYGDVVEEDELWDNPASFQYLIENHFDYHGLIEKGLATDATNLNIY